MIGNMYMYTIEHWWKHLCSYERAQASGIAYNKENNYLIITDDWWDNLTDIQKKSIYETYFEEY